MSYVKKNSRWLLPIFLMLIIAPFTPWLDLSFERLFDRGPPVHFPAQPFYDFMFDFGSFPAFFVAGTSALTLFLSYVSPKWKHWRKPAMLLVLTVTVGAGFIVHTVLKDHWGRPRPRQVLEFGGAQEFRPFYKPNFWNQPEPSKSFPCGHCTMGFYFFTLAIVCKRAKFQILSNLSMAAAWVIGLLMGLARMAQGGHFFSDILMCALIMWLVALVFDWFLYEAGNI